MTPRERVLAAINHQEPDRVPIILGVSNATGIKMKTYQKLKTLLGVEGEDRYLYDWPELGTAVPTETIFQRLGTDVRPVLDRHPAANFLANASREPHTPFFDSIVTGSRGVKVNPDRDPIQFRVRSKQHPVAKAQGL